jgi:hypothetical protein
VVIWYNSPRFGILYQEKSGNPERSVPSWERFTRGPHLSNQNMFGSGTDVTNSKMFLQKMATKNGFLVQNTASFFSKLEY